MSVIPVVVEALRVLTKLKKYIREFRIDMRAGQSPQKAALWGTARILRLVLGC